MGHSCSQPVIDSEDFAKAFPVELRLTVLSFLSATDLCRASRVCRAWHALASHDSLWRVLCNESLAGQLCRDVAAVHKMRWKAIYRVINQSLFLFNMNSQLQAMETLLLFGALKSAPTAISQFLYTNPNRRLRKRQILVYLTMSASPQRDEVLKAFVGLYPVKGVFLVDALRVFFRSLALPSSSGTMNSLVLEQFAEHYYTQNPGVCREKDTLLVLCFSLLFLASDLSTPAVKNKMSKREFIRNVKKSIPETDPVSMEYLGALYDNLFLGGLGYWRPPSLARNGSGISSGAVSDDADDNYGSTSRRSRARSIRYSTCSLRCKAVLNRLDGQSISTHLVELTA